MPVITNRINSTQTIADRRERAFRFIGGDYSGREAAEKRTTARLEFFSQPAIITNSLPGNGKARPFPGFRSRQVTGGNTRQSKFQGKEKCNVREYEVTVVIQPQLEEAERTQVIERLGNLLVPGSKDDGALTANHWGVRQLAYPIKKFQEGYYVLFEAKIDPSRIRDIERSMQFNEDVLRYLVVRKGD
jgi:small subunit ribosomal protein S6